MGRGGLRANGSVHVDDDAWDCTCPIAKFILTYHAFDKAIYDVSHTNLLIIIFEVNVNMQNYSQSSA